MIMIAFIVLLIVFSLVAVASLIIACLAYQNYQTCQSGSGGGGTGFARGRQTGNANANANVQYVPGPMGPIGPTGPPGLPGLPHVIPTFNHDLYVENVDHSFDEISAHAEGWWDPESGYGSLCITGAMQATVPTAGAQLDRCRVHIPHLAHWHHLRGEDFGFEDWGVDRYEIFSGTRSHDDVSFSLQVENFEVRAERMHDLRVGHEDTVLDFTVEATNTDVSAATGEPGFTHYEVVVSLLRQSLCGEHVCDCRCRERCCRRKKKRKHKKLEQFEKLGTEVIQTPSPSQQNTTVIEMPVVVPAVVPAVVPTVVPAVVPTVVPAVVPVTATI